MHAQNKEIHKAEVEAARARKELTRAGVCDEFADRLAALEAAISSTSKALQLRQKALEEMEAASRSVEQAQARLSLPIFENQLHIDIGTDLLGAGQRRQNAGEDGETARSKCARSSCPGWERRGFDDSIEGSGCQSYSSGGMVQGM
jgi:hypothetical protein